MPAEEWEPQMLQRNHRMSDSIVDGDFEDEGQGGRLNPRLAWLLLLAALATIGIAAAVILALT